MTPDLDDTIATPPTAGAGRPSSSYLEEETVPATDFIRGSPRRIPAPSSAAEAPRPMTADVDLSLLLPDGTVVPLDAPVVLGRAPGPPRVPGLSEPRRVVLSSPRHEVSGSHVEFRPVGRNVIVQDLRSSNGTLLLRPGAAGRRLHPGASEVVTLGTRIDLGDGNVVSLVAADTISRATP